MAVSDTGPTTEGAPISGLVAMIHVADVERSAEFYWLLGFEIGNYVPPAGRIHWAWSYAPKAADWKRGPNLMLSRSARPIDASAQDVLFYLYAADLDQTDSSWRHRSGHRHFFGLTDGRCAQPAARRPNECVECARGGDRAEEIARSRPSTGLTRALHSPTVVDRIPPGVGSSNSMQIW